MDPQLWKQVDECSRRRWSSPEKRKSFVAEASQGNAIIYEEVLSLLDAQARAAEFMEGSDVSGCWRAGPELTTIATLVGKEVGTYKIEKLLGAGGMAEVYLARDGKLDACSRAQRSCRGISLAMPIALRVSGVRRGH